MKEAESGETSDEDGRITSERNKHSEGDDANGSGAKETTATSAEN